MKIKTNLFLLLLSLLFISLILYAQDKQRIYVGTRKCKTCHKKEKIGNQYKIWKESKHAEAYKTLLTEKADSISLSLDNIKKAVENQKCLKCHVTAYDADKSLLGKKYKKEDGIGCESCHGAGKGYSKKKIMKKHELAVQNGLVEYKDEADIEKQCKTCHNEDSPTYKEFEFKKRWEDIKHPIPEKK